MAAAAQWAHTTWPRSMVSGATCIHQGRDMVLGSLRTDRLMLLGLRRLQQLAHLTPLCECADGAITSARRGDLRKFRAHLQFGPEEPAAVHVEGATWLTCRDRLCVVDPRLFGLFLGFFPCYAAFWTA